MNKKLYWEYPLCNVELNKEISVYGLYIQPICDFRKLAEKLGKNVFIETIKVKGEHDFSEKEIEYRIAILISLLSFAQGRNVVFFRKFSMSETDQPKEYHLSTIFGKATGTKIILNNELEDFLKKSFEKINSDKVVGNTIQKALFWYNEGHKFSSVQEFFIRRWISFEIFVEMYYQKYSLSKKIVPKNKFPKEEIEKAIVPVLENNDYFPKNIDLVVRQIGNLNRINFILRSLRFLKKEINLPYLEYNKDKLDSLYVTRNKLFHEGFTKVNGNHVSNQGMLLEKLVQRIILTKLGFKNRYYYGNFWVNPFVRAVEKIPKSR